MSQKKTPLKTNRPSAATATDKKKAKPAAKEIKKKAPAPGDRKQALFIKGLAIFIAALGFAIYAQTLRYSFTLDDRIVIVENNLTNQGIKAIPQIFTHAYLYGSVLPDDNIYRPVSKAVFAFCWSIAPDGPGFFHFMNVLFYALTGLMLFLTLLKYFNKKVAVPLITTLLFIVHPIHTEVVDSIKSLDEILCFLFFIISLFYVHVYLEKNKTKFLVIAAFCFFLSFLSKESGIAYLAVFPLILFFIKRNKSEILRISLSMLAAAIVVFGIRFLVLGASSSVQVLPADNILAGTDSFFIQRVTAIYLMGKYLLLLIFPHPLVCDYTTKELALVGAGDWRFIVSFIIWLGLFAYAIIRIKKRDWIGFGILFFLIAFSVTSNIFIIGGTHFAERFMYAPLLGFCLAIAVILDRFINRQGGESKVVTVKQMLTARPVIYSITAVIALLFIFKTVTQNPVWANNIVLFEHAIKCHPTSYRPHIAIADDLSNQKYLAQFPKEEQQKLIQRAISEIKISLNIFPDVRCYDMLGVIYHVNEQYDSSYYYYEKGLKMKPDHESLNAHMGKVLNKMGKYDEAIPYLNQAVEKNPNNSEAYFGLAMSYTNKGDNDTGLKYFLKVNQLNPQRADAWYYAGMIYKAKGDNTRANEYLNKAQALGGVKGQ
jgi:protein O-mannosyl-transferase